MLKRSIAVVLMIAFSFASTFAADCPPPKRAVPIPTLKGTSYHQARARLFAAGWFPVQTKPRGVTPDNDPDIASGNGRLFWERGYLEVEGCAGTGLAPCAFRWADKYGNQFSVFTRGEEAPEQKAFAMVSGGRFLCPGER
jgi:hypothetical protein